MIRLFVTDIDGCLATPYQPFQLEVLSQIREFARLGGTPGSDSVLPAVSICSGRAYPYVEAMSQLLDLKCPVLFEAGAGLFDPVAMQCRWHPGLSEQILVGMASVKAFMVDLANGTELSVDRAKRSQVAVVAPDKKHIEEVYDEVCSYVTASHPAFRTFMTPFSIDVVSPGLTKREGIEWLAQICSIDRSEMAFVGDSDGDIGALESVGRSFAPENADNSVKEIVDVVTAGSDVNGVLEAYQNVVEFNQGQNRQT